MFLTLPEEINISKDITQKKPLNKSKFTKTSKEDQNFTSRLYKTPSITTNDSNETQMGNKETQHF
jgi:hypothetical protein